MKLHTIEDLKPVDFYIQHFANANRKTYRDKQRCADSCDLRQEAVLNIIKAYPSLKKKLEDGAKINIFAYLWHVVNNRLTTYKLENGFVVVPKNYKVYKEHREDFNTVLSTTVDVYQAEQFLQSASGVTDFTEDVDLRLDVETFAEKNDPLGVINLKLQGYNLREISAMLDVDYRQLITYNDRLRERLSAFLVQQ